MNTDRSTVDDPVRKFSSAIDFSDLDHLVIGSGMGGLTTAVWLAKAGKKVAVFERHYVPGGFTHSFKRKKPFRWDVGVHYVGNVAKDSDLRSMFDYLTEGQVDWESMGEVYDEVRINGDSYQFRAGKEEFRKQLVAYFPEERSAIDDYLMLIEKANRSGNLFFLEKTFPPFVSRTVGRFLRKRHSRYSQRTTYEVLAGLTSNERLISVLCGQCGDYGLSPRYSSFSAHAAVVGHFMEGGFYPVGGSDQIAKKTIDTLVANGGEVYINADVSEIVVEKGRVQGVKIDGHFVSCKSVISNVGVRNTFGNLLTEESRTRCRYDLKEVQASTAHMCLYVGLDRSDAALDLPRHNIWYYKNERYDRLLDEITLDDAADRFAYISFPSAKDPQWQVDHPNTSTIQAMTAGNHDWFSQFEHLPWMKRGEVYKEMKEEFERSMLARLYELVPQIKGHVVETEVSTPLSTQHFSNYGSGEIYGLAHTPERYDLPFLRPETRIKGLHLVGQDITMVGVASAMVAGVLTAVSILKYRCMRNFKDVGRYKSK